MNIAAWAAAAAFAATYRCRVFPSDVYTFFVSRFHSPLHSNTPERRDLDSDIFMCRHPATEETHRAAHAQHFVVLKVLGVSANDFHKKWRRNVNSSSCTAKQFSIDSRITQSDAIVYMCIVKTFRKEIELVSVVTMLWVYCFFNFSI